MNPVSIYQDRTNAQRQDHLVVDNLEFVRHILGRLLVNLPASVDTENLEAAGILGLVEAAQQFDATRGVPFKGYAHTRIRGAILDELRRNSPLPQHIMQQVSCVRKAMESLTSPVTVEELTEATGLEPKTVQECLAAMRMTHMQRWEESFAGVSTTPGDEFDPSQQLDENEKREILADCLEELPRQERLAITLYYLEDLRLKEIGQVLGLSESRTCRLMKSAKDRLRTLMESRIG